MAEYRAMRFKIHKGRNARMAIYHFSAQVASRSAGRSAIAMAAYRSGDRLHDERTGETKFYRRDAKPQTEIIAPAHSPAWVHDRNRLWNEVEKAEKRKDAQLCREINVALPKEFTARRQTEMLYAYCQKQFVERGMIADVAIHRDDADNPHAHIMLTMRQIGPDGFGPKVREWNERDLMENWREAWAQDVNRIFENANRPERIDHRSLEKQGITDRIPTIHEGPTVRDMEKKGKQTDRGDINRAAKAHNAIVYEMQSYLKKREEVLQELAQSQRVSQPKSMKQVDDEHNHLYNQRREKIAEIKKLETTLKQIEQCYLLLQERNKLKEQIKALEPKGFLRRIWKSNENEIRALHRDLDRIENRIINDHKYTPNRAEVPRIQKEMSVLQGAFKALDRAFQEIGRQRSQMQQEERMRLRQHTKSQNRDRGWER